MVLSALARSSSTNARAGVVDAGLRSAVARTASACGAELVERTVAVLAHTEVDLRDRVEAEALDEVDQQPELDTPPLDERQHLERFAPARVLAAERLHDVGELREEQREQRARDQLGDAAAAGRRAFVGAVVVAPSRSTTSGRASSGSTQRGHVVGREVAEVGVEPADDVAPALVQRLPQHVALARTRHRLRAGSSASATTRAPAAAGDLGGAVDRPVVDHDDLVDTATRSAAACAGRVDDRADRRRLVAGREAHGDENPARLRTRIGVRLSSGPDVAPISEPATVRCYSARARAHPERLRDRPFDAAATSRRTDAQPARVRGARCQCLTDETA